MDKDRVCKDAIDVISYYLDALKQYVENTNFTEELKKQKSMPSSITINVEMSTWYFEYMVLNEVDLYLSTKELTIINRTKKKRIRQKYFKKAWRRMISDKDSMINRWSRSE